jgi:hypothetical protein
MATKNSNSNKRIRRSSSFPVNMLSSKQNKTLHFKAKSDSIGEVKRAFSSSSTNLARNHKESLGTPKIIHFLWIDFNNETDGILDETLIFFKNRIEQLHPIKNGWTINFISSWNKCLETIKNVKWLNDLVNNKNVGAAHKSDALRYYYLYTIGGIWIDISTFLVSSLDELVIQNNEGFTCYYMPSDVCASWLIRMPSDIFENITLKQYYSTIIPKQNKVINIKDKNFDFISENYFLISSKGNEVCKNVYEQLQTFWIQALPNIQSKQNYCYELNKLMFDLFKKAYNINVVGFPYIDLVEAKLSDIEGMKEIILKEYFDCSYFFNYIQLYLAIRDYSKANNGTLTNLHNSDKKTKIINLPELSSFSKELCNGYSCNNKVISFRNEKKNIHLLSASYNRLSKWSDVREKRINWEDTIVGNIIKYEDDPNTVLRILKDHEITQLKYSSYTRSRSDSIRRLKILFSNYIKTSGGKKNKLNQINKVNNINKVAKTSKTLKKYIGSRGGVYIIREGKKIYIK